MIWVAKHMNIWAVQELAVLDNIVSGNAQLLINNDNTIEISAEGTIDNGDSFNIYFSGTNELYLEY